MSITIGGNKPVRVRLHHVMLLAFTPKRCKRVGEPSDKITEQWQRHRQLRKLDQRPLVVNRTKARHMGISQIIKVMVTSGMAIKGTATKGKATKGMATKGKAINIQDISKASISMRGPKRLL